MIHRMKKLRSSPICCCCCFFLTLSFCCTQCIHPVADPENFGGGGFEAQNLKNSDIFTKIESDFSAELGNSNVFFAQIQVVSKKKKKVFTKIESDFSAELGNSNVFFAQIQVVFKKKLSLHQN